MGHSMSSGHATQMAQNTDPESDSNPSTQTGMGGNNLLHALIQDQPYLYNVVSMFYVYHIFPS